MSICRSRRERLQKADPGAFRIYGGEDMLALSRKKNEAIVINNNIEITILDVRGDQVKVGIAAPKEIPIYRKEVYLQIQQENAEATNLGGIEELQRLLGGV